MPLIRGCVNLIEPASRLILIFPGHRSAGVPVTLQRSSDLRQPDISQIREKPRLQQVKPEKQQKEEKKEEQKEPPQPCRNHGPEALFLHSPLPCYFLRAGRGSRPGSCSRGCTCRTRGRLRRRSRRLFRGRFRRRSRFRLWSSRCRLSMLRRPQEIERVCSCRLYSLFGETPESQYRMPVNDEDPVPARRLEHDRRSALFLVTGNKLEKKFQIRRLVRPVPEPLGKLCKACCHLVKLCKSGSALGLLGFPPWSPLRIAVVI